MAINVYTGVMGSGKSYEITLNVVIPAVLAGRRVVTNIDGINQDLIHDYLRDKHPTHTSDFGSIVHVTDAQISLPEFFPDESKPGGSSVVQPGDLVVVDEAWRHWSSNQKLSPEHQQFFRMHRHFVDSDSGVSCDLALVFQSITDISRPLRAVIELNFRTTKLKSIGLNGSYRIEWWEGGKQTKTTFVGRRITRYDKAIFPLYKSYSGAGGTEVAIDSRQNIFKNPRLWAGIALMLCVSGYATWFLWGFLHPEQPDSVPVAIASPANAAVAVSTSPAPPANASSNFRIGGVIKLPGRSPLVVIVDREGRLAYDSAHSYVGKGVFLVGDHQGTRVNTSPFLR